MTTKENDERFLLLESFKRNPNRFIDHTNLKPSSGQNEIEKLCEEAIRFRFKSICVNPFWVKFCKDSLSKFDENDKNGEEGSLMRKEDESVEVCTVVGFPLGANSSKVKAFEIQKALEDGASEIDMVINVGLLISKTSNPKEIETESIEDFKEDFLRSIQPIIDLSGSKEKRPILKVIIETSLLTKSQIRLVSKVLSRIEYVDFVKTSTGFNGPGANVENVETIKSSIDSNKDDRRFGDCQIKASGGIKSFEDCLKFVEAGASRLGTSSGVKIMEDWNSRNNQ